MSDPALEINPVPIPPPILDYENVKSVAPALSRARAATSVAFLVTGVLAATWISRIPFIQEQLHIGNATLGMILLMTSIGAMISMRLTGRIVVRFGSRIGVPVSLLIFSLALVLPGLATNAITLAMALVTVGMGFGAVDVAINAQAVTVEARYGRPVMASFHALFSLGGMIGAGFGILAASIHLGALGEFSAVAALMCLLSFRLGHWLLHDLEKHGENPGDAPRRLFATRQLMILGVIAFCSSIAEGGVFDWSGVYLTQISHARDAIVPLGFAGFSLAMTTGRFTGDRLTALLGPVRMVRFGAALAITGLIIAMLFPASPTAILGFTFVGLGVATLVPIVYSAAGRAPGVPASVAIASVATLGYSGGLVGPPLIGFASKMVTLRWALLLMVLGCCCSGALSRNVAPTPKTQG